MRIRKWYLDCTAADGTVFIGYAGTLGFGPVTLPIQSATLYPTDAAGRTRWRLASDRPSVDAGGGIRWSARALGIQASWAARSEPVSRVLLSTPELRVEWRCHLPRGWARVAVEGHTLEGWGYVEEMRIDGNVRRLPLTELHWGRFLSAAHGVVWLSWKGSQPLTLVLVDSEERSGSVTRDGVMVDGWGRIPLPEAVPSPEAAGGVRMLAQQRVGDAFFPSLPPLRRILPRILAGLRERKLSGPGRPHRGPGVQTGEGWLLYETVEFP